MAAAQPTGQWFNRDSATCCLFWCPSLTELSWESSIFLLEKSKSLPKELSKPGQSQESEDFKFMSSWVRGLESEVRVSQDQGPGWGGNLIESAAFLILWDGVGLNCAEAWNFVSYKGWPPDMAREVGLGQVFSTLPVLSHLSETCKANFRVPWLCFSVWIWEWYCCKGSGRRQEKERRGRWWMNSDEEGGTGLENKTDFGLFRKK